jgi:fucose permease
VGLAIVLMTSALVSASGADAAPPRAWRGGTYAPAERVGLSTWAFFGSFFFLYGGSEAAIGGWMTELAHRLAPPSSGAFAAAAFWGGLTAGRAAVAALVADKDEARTALGGALLAVAAGVGLVVARDARIAIAAGALAGIGLAPLFPITVAVLSRGYASRGAGPLISLSGVGGAILPGLVGVISTRSGSLQTGVLVPLSGCIVLGGLHAGFWLRRPRANAL